MKILAFESSAKAASVALLSGDALLGESFQNNGKTHSATLMPMAQQLLQDCGVPVQELDLIAVAKGPGSFTGVRIGVAAAKGLAWAAEKPICGVSTLEAMAQLLVSCTGVICPVMDARRAQVYNALFHSDGLGLRRLTEDRAISLEELADSLKNIDSPIFLVGDGSRLCYNTLKPQISRLILPPPHLEMQRASGVALAAVHGTPLPPEELVPNYLRLSQAERERQYRLKQSNEKLKGDLPNGRTACTGPSSDPT